MNGRFDSVKYSDASADKQFAFKKAFDELALSIERVLAKGPASSLALVKLEESYMWVGKAIRDEQHAGMANPQAALAPMPADERADALEGLNIAGRHNG